MAQTASSFFPNTREEVDGCQFTITQTSNFLCLTAIIPLPVTKPLNEVKLIYSNRKFSELHESTSSNMERTNGLFMQG